MHNSDIQDLGKHSNTESPRWQTSGNTDSRLGIKPRVLGGHPTLTMPHPMTVPEEDSDDLDVDEHPSEPKVKYNDVQVEMVNDAENPRMFD